MRLTTRWKRNCAALRPHEVSPDLRRRIADRLADPCRQDRDGGGGLALAGGLAAACLAAVLLPGEAAGASNRSTIVLVPPAPPVEVEDSGPTLLAYQRAWPDRPKTWMPCSTSTPWPPRNPTRNSCESVLSLGPMPNYVPC